MYTTSNSDKSYNILLVEDISGIVVCQNGKYGIINSIGRLIVPCVFDRIYSEIAGGEKTYYMQFEGNTTELNTYLRENGIEIDTPNGDDNSGMIDLNATPTPNLDLETPNVIQKPSPSPSPEPSNKPIFTDIGNDL